MTEKELFVKLCEKWVIRATNLVGNARKSLQQGHSKLKADFDLTIYNLELAIREAEFKRKNLAADVKPVDIGLADFAIERAKMALEYGRIKAQSDFETGYNTLKLEVENKTVDLTQEKDYLEFAEAEKSRGFSL